MDLSHYTRFLSHLPVFRGLNEREIAEFVQAFNPQQYKDGEVICREGDPGDAVFVVESGAIRVSKKTEQGDVQQIATLQAPTVIGEMALLDEEPRSATVQAVGQVSLYRIDSAEFNLLRRNWSTAAFKVIRNLAGMLCRRLRETNEEIDRFYADPHASLETMRQRQQDLWQKRQHMRGGR
jgi:CRP-like cAMP-binding protein